jgi:lysophospholipase L1-like esterase
MPTSASPRFLSAFLLCFLAAASGAMADDANALQPFPDKTKWDLVGDSITQIGMYGFYADVFYHTRFPKNSLDVYNCGIPGETAEQGLKRYSWDMAANQPTVASIMFGMNDVNRWLYLAAQQGPQYDPTRQESIDKWDKNTRALIELFKKDNVQVILIEPSIFDDTSTMAAENAPGLNLGLGKMAQHCVDIAREENVGLVDFYHPMLDLNKKVQASDPAATIIGPDRIHPQNAGQLYMAYLFLKAQNVPAEVSHVTIDGMSGQVSDTGNCTVTEAKTDSGGVSFTCLANALPFPIDPDAAQAIKWAPEINDINKEMLTVANLKSGSYDLSIDGQKIRSYTAEELAAGVNLALESNTPEQQQAMKVMKALQGGWGCQYVLRAIAAVEAWAPDLPRPVSLADMEPVLQAKLKDTPGAAWSTEQAVAAAPPVAHTFKISPAAQ